MTEGDTLANALIGAVVTVLTSTVVVPVAPIVGGAVSGYLEGGSRNDGARVGALSGLIALLPLVFFLALIGNFVLAVLVGTDAPFPGLGGAGLLALGLLSVGAAVYVVVFGALGGWLGNYLKHDAEL